MFQVSTTMTCAFAWASRLARRSPASEKSEWRPAKQQEHKEVLGVFDWFIVVVARPFFHLLSRVTQITLPPPPAPSPRPAPPPQTSQQLSTMGVAQTIPDVAVYPG